MYSKFLEEEMKTMIKLLNKNNKKLWKHKQGLKHNKKKRKDSSRKDNRKKRNEKNKKIKSKEERRKMKKKNY
jgi:hypothetical protein